MRRQKLFISFAAIAMLLFVSVVASAQNGDLRGHVVLKQADGTTVPVTNATVDIFRVDIQGKWNVKTNKKGEFVYVGLPYVGTYVIAASAPNAQPTFIPNVKVGRDIDYPLELTPGDGRRLTEAEAKTAAASTKPAASSGSSESAEDRKKREEIEAKNREIEEKNKNISATNDIVSRTFKAGNEARAAKRYDEAIAQYDEGIKADPQQVALWIGKSEAYRMRGVDRYNAAVQSKDMTAKESGMEEAKKDFTEAAAAGEKAVEASKAEAANTDPSQQAAITARKLAALSTRAESVRLYVSKADSSKADQGLTAYTEYLAVETDPERKAKAQMAAAQMLLDAGASDKAFIEFKKILDTTPDNPDANLGAGLALFGTGDKAKYQEAANYLQHFVDIAPDTHKFKADAKAILTEMKNTEKIEPQKTTTPARRRRG